MVVRLDSNTKLSPLKSRRAAAARTSADKLALLVLLHMLRRLLRADKFIVEFAATRNVEPVAAFWRCTVRRALQNCADGALGPVCGGGVCGVRALHASQRGAHDPIL